MRRSPPGPRALLQGTEKTSRLPRYGVPIRRGPQGPRAPVERPEEPLPAPCQVQTCVPRRVGPYSSMLLEAVGAGVIAEGLPTRPTRRATPRRPQGSPRGITTLSPLTPPEPRLAPREILHSLNRAHDETKRVATQAANERHDNLPRGGRRGPPRTLRPQQPPHIRTATP